MGCLWIKYRGDTYNNDEGKEVRKMRIKSLALAIALSGSLFTASWVSAQVRSLESDKVVVDQARVELIKGIQERNEQKVMNIPGVVGIGIGLTEDGKELCFIVYLEKVTASARATVPVRIEGVPVRIVESGIFEAY